MFLGKALAHCFGVSVPVVTISGSFLRSFIFLLLQLAHPLRQSLVASFLLVSIFLLNTIALASLPIALDIPKVSSLGGGVGGQEDQDSEL